MLIEQPIEKLLIIKGYHERATKGKRLANYLIDLFAFNLIPFVIAFAYGFLHAIISPSSVTTLADESVGFDIDILNRIVWLMLYALYMSITEAIFKGKSLGKLITKTRAVNLDGSQISTSTAFARGFIRAVPFCVFSALGTPCNPFQDRWTNTMVIDETK